MTVKQLLHILGIVLKQIIFPVLSYLKIDHSKEIPLLF